MKSAFVTGATSGIGLAIAEALLEEGCFVHINYAHDEERSGRVSLQLAKYKGSFELCRADLSSKVGVDSVISSLRERASPLGYLVLNFALTDRTSFGEITLEDWERVFRANVTVPFFLVQGMCNAGILAGGSSALCVGSLMASIPHSSSVSYGTSKAALSAMCQHLAKFLAPSGIRINAIEPGFIDTPWQNDKTPEHRARIEARTALGRFGMAREVAEISLAVLKNSYMTGTVVPIGGGYGLL